MTEGDFSHTNVRPGDVLADKYRVERVIGVGGMGVVVAAHHLQLDEKVAIKLLLAGARVSSEMVARFIREARAAVKIKSEHVARVIDVGQLESGAPYMVMEHLEGSDLAARIAKLGPLSIQEATDFVLQACEALAQAHALGIVHRDLKPANLFCVQTPDGKLAIKVLDFGISKITTPGAPGHDMTRTNALLGSPLYMSPEQLMASKNVDARTDIWSLGVILFQLVSGETPFDAEAVTELAIKIANQPPVSLSTLRADGSGLEGVIARCLEKDRERRYQNVAELALALAPFGSRTALASVDRITGTLRNAGMLAEPRAPFPSSSATLPLDPASDPRLALPAPPPSAPITGTDASWGKTGNTDGQARTRGALLAGLAFGALGIVGLGLIAIVTLPALRKVRTTEPSSSAVPAVLPAASPVVSSFGAAPAIMPVESASKVTVVPSASNVVVAAAAATVPRPVARTSTLPAPVPPAQPSVAPSAAPPRATAKPSCDPPYDIDANGTRVFKKECL